MYALINGVTATAGHAANAIFLRYFYNGK
jgi:hypothetical protein